MSPAVLVRSAAELAAVANANPYAHETEPKKIHVLFLADAPTAAERKAAKDLEREAADKGSRDDLTIIERAAYLHTPDGYGRSVLAELLARRSSPTALGTARNWSTVTKLREMCERG